MLHIALLHAALSWSHIPPREAIAPPPRATGPATRMVASFYWQGSICANGERFRPNGLTCAHRSLRFGTRLRVSYRGRSVVVRCSDRGPFVRGRDLDLSLGAAKAIGMTDAGVAVVRVETVR